MNNISKRRRVKQQSLYSINRLEATTALSSPPLEKKLSAQRKYADSTMSPTKASSNILENVILMNNLYMQAIEENLQLPNIKPKTGKF